MCIFSVQISLVNNQIKQVKQIIRYMYVFSSEKGVSIMSSLVVSPSEYKEGYII